MSDITLSNNVVRTPLYVNSLLLAACSPYFNNIFMNNFKDMNKKEIEIILEENQIPHFISMIHFLYHGEFPNPGYDFTEMLGISDKFNFPCVFEATIKDIRNRKLSVEVCCNLLDRFPINRYLHIQKK